jgi:drug/metabolite transporter (DMT)-like permease
LAGIAAVAPKTLRISRSDFLFMTIYGLLGVASLHLLGIWSVKINSVSIAIVLLYTSPVFIVLWTLISRRELVKKHELITVVIVLTGIALAFQVLDPARFRYNRSGLLVGILAGIAFAFSTLWGKHGLPRFHPLTLSVYGMGVAALFWLISGLPLRFLFSGQSVETWCYLGLVALLGTLFMPVFYLMGMRTISAAEGNLTASMEQVFAMGLSVLLLKEQLETIQFVGLALVVAGVTYLQVKGLKTEPIASASVCPEVRREDEQRNL